MTSIYYVIYFISLMLPLINLFSHLHTFLQFFLLSESKGRRRNLKCNTFKEISLVATKWKSQICRHGLDKFKFYLLQALNAASVDFVFYDSFRHFCGSTKTISYKHCLCSSEMQNGHNTVFANAVSSKNNICYY